MYRYSTRSRMSQFIAREDLDDSRGHIATVFGGMRIFDLNTFESTFNVPIPQVVELEQTFFDLRTHVILGWREPVQAPNVWGGQLMLYIQSSAEDESDYRALHRSMQGSDFTVSASRRELPPTTRCYDHRVTTILEVFRDPKPGQSCRVYYAKVADEFAEIARSELIRLRAELSARDIAQELASDERPPDVFALEPSL